MLHPTSPRRQLLALALCGTALATAYVRLHRPVPAAAYADHKTAGAELFGSRGCAHCHGMDGKGTDRAPALRDLRKKISTDKMHDQIVHGGQGMPAFGDSLKPEEVDDLVSFLRAKKWIDPPAPPAGKDGAAPAPATPPAPGS